MTDITRQGGGGAKKALGWAAAAAFPFALAWAMGWPEFVKTLALGLPLGAIIALIAIGYSMVYGIIQLINFAHGEVVMLASYIVLMFLWGSTGEGADLRWDFPPQVKGVPLFVPAVSSILVGITTFISLNALGAATVALRDPKLRWPLAGGVAAAFGFACWLALLNDAFACVLASLLAGLAFFGATRALLVSRTHPPSKQAILAASAGVGAAGAVGAWLLVFGGGIFLSAVALSLAITATIGVTLDTIAYKPLRSAPRLIPLITAIGMSITFQSAARVIWGQNPHSFDQEKLPSLMRQPDPISDADLYALPRPEQIAKGRCLIFKLRANAAAILEFDEEKDARAAQAAIEATPGVASTRLAIESYGCVLTIRMEPDAEGGVEPALKALAAKGIEPAYSDPFLDETYLRLQAIDILIVTVCLAVFIALQILIHKTRLGKAMRACSQDKVTARLVGVNVDQVVAITFIVGSILAALVAPLCVLKNVSLVKPDMGLIVGILAFASAVLGGIGNIKGAMFGGLAIGLVYTFVPSVENFELWPLATEHRVLSQEAATWIKKTFFEGLSQWRLGVAYGVMILVIIVRPAGLFGRASAHRA